MNNYRVDRSDNPSRCPCGMNSLVYLGDNAHQANTAFARAQTGVSTWGEENPAYGVILSVWSPTQRDYVVKRSKGF